MDETELSFIRCPNCRSLVPAVASRCRMCGFILKDASSKQVSTHPDQSLVEAAGSAAKNPQEDLSEERPSRVRQRTISVSGNSNPAANISESRPESPPVIPPVLPPEPAEAPKLPESILTRSREVPSIEQLPFEELDESFEDDFEDEDEEVAGATEQVANSENTIAPESELIKKKRRRRRRRKKPAPIAGMETAPMPAPAPIHAPIPAPVSEARHEPVMAPAPRLPKSTPAPEEAIAPWRTPPPPGDSRPGFRIEKPSEQKAPEPVEAREKVENQRIQEPRQEAKQDFRQSHVSGSLVGWLVSFAEDRRGISHELRDGRFFVGREQLRNTDFVIDHSTVSTPQCLVVCDPVSGVTIQDLMSEKGTTLIRGSSALEKSSEQVRLENGDKIRFGEYEMLFVKLPQTR